ncbi:MAG: hypothetical protein MMC33_008749 [Icmadophila ericetorum]|nr:hypothetical protein [Icmadophila ericetorum]
MSDSTGLYGFGSLKHGFHTTSTGSTVSFYHSNISQSEIEAKGAPVLVLVHGWPQTSYMWRHLIPMLSDEYPLFVPDVNIPPSSHRIQKSTLTVPIQLPGYGSSTLSTTGNDKLTYSTALIESLYSVYGPKITTILIGHDRGARTLHRLCVSRADFPNLQILGLILADIIPTYEQFAAFSNPVALTRYFHWGFLPNTALSIPMIKAFGGANFCRMIMQSANTGGANENGIANLFSHGSLDVYARHFNKAEMIEGTCRDYEAASKEDYAAQIEDQKEGRKLDVPTLVLYSEKNLGAMADVPVVWKRWVKEGTRLETKGIGEGYGHFFLEEAPELSYEHIIAFCKSLGNQASKLGKRASEKNE